MVKDYNKIMVAENCVKKVEKQFTIKNNIIVGNDTTRLETRGIARIILDSLDSSPDSIFQINVHTGEKTTFAEVKERSVRCALWLKKQGIGKDDIVCISTPHQIDDFIPMLATLYVGAIFNPWYHELSYANALRFFKVYQPKIMFAYDKSIDMLSDISKETGINCKFVAYGKHSKYPSLRYLISQQSQIDVNNFQPLEPDNPKNQPSMILFSSGTTGIPKGTMLSYETLAINNFKSLNIEEQSNFLWHSSLSWITGAKYILICIKMKITRIMQYEFDPEETSNVIEKYKVNLLLWTPSMLTRCFKANVFKRYDYSSLKTLSVGGSRTSRAVLEGSQEALPHTFVLNGYGMTEMGDIALRQTKDRKRIDSVGFVIEGVKMKVVDPATGQILGPNKEGELCFKLASVTLGYYKNPEETSKIFDSEGWLHTGDLGYYDEDGEVMVIDRIKQLIITQNYHVSPSEIEEILMRHPDVMECAVVAVPHHIDIERPLAFVIKMPGSKVTADELERLPASLDEYYRLTGGVVFVDELLYTSTGKKNYKELKEMAKAYANGHSS